MVSAFLYDNQLSFILCLLIWYQILGGNWIICFTKCVAWPQQFRTLKVDMTAGPQGKWQGIATLDSRFRLMWYFEASQTKIFRSVFTAFICACSLLQSLTMPLVKNREEMKLGLLLI
jgi:hypothetical protein